jgi:nucleoside-diphosphate-sugar epimerase
MTVLVTGGDGFIGSFLVEELVARGNKVRCLVLEGKPLQHLRPGLAEICYGDICRPETLEDAVKGVESIYHLAGVKTAWDDATYFRVNYEGTKNLLGALLQGHQRIGRFLHVSSQAAAGPSPDGHPITENDTCHPLTSYGKSKRSAEEYLLTNNHRVPITIVRPTLVYGPRSVEIELLFAIMKWGLMPLIRKHKQVINLLYVRDVVEGIILAAEHEQASGQIYFITSQDRYTWQEIFEQSLRLQNRNVRLMPIPWAAIKLAAGMIKSYRRVRGLPSNLIDDKMNELLEQHWVCSGQKARRDLGFDAKTSLQKGLEETIRWYHETGR